MGKRLKWLAGFSALHSSAGLPSYPFVCRWGLARRAWITGASSMAAGRVPKITETRGRVAIGSWAAAPVEAGKS